MDGADDLPRILAESPVFQDVPPDQLAEIAARLAVKDYPAGEIIVREGQTSAAVYFLISGRLAVRVRRGSERETLAWMNPPEIFGELSFVTGRPAVADVEVVVQAKVAQLTREAFPPGTPYHAAVMQGLTRMIAGRLQSVVASGFKARPAPIVLLAPDRAWPASRSFAAELSKALERETIRPTLLVEIGAEDRPIESLGRAGVVRVRTSDKLRLAEWRERFPNIILNPVENGTAGDAAKYADWRGVLLGPGSPPPIAPVGPHFMVQDLAKPMLPVLDGGRQLIADAAESEAQFRDGREVTMSFARTAGSIARWIAGTQVGLALGGGAAWGWCHIGVLQALEEHGIPVDMIGGCSMGAVIGGLRATGMSIADLIGISEYWRTRTLRFVEWRAWRFCLINERKVRRIFREYFGDRKVNQTVIPFRVIAADIQSGTALSLTDGPLWECLRASVALPGLLPPVPRGDSLLLDASIVDPVPIDLVRGMGAHFGIAVNAMVAPGAQRMTAKYPLNLFEITMRSLFVMGHSIGESAAQKSADIVFTPDLAEVSILQFKRSREIIAAGKRVTEERMPEIRALYERRKQQALG